MNEMKVSVEGLEKERDFYFNKVGFLSFVLCGVGGREDAGRVEGGGLRAL